LECSTWSLEALEIRGTGDTVRMIPDLWIHLSQFLEETIHGGLDQSLLLRFRAHGKDYDIV